MASVSYKQLRGEEITEETDTSSCDPVVYNKDINFNSEENLKSVSGTDLDKEAVAHPCGIAARSIFNDFFVLKDSSDTEIPISSKGIAWEDDLKYRYC